jgi:hypothetical protein
MYSSWARNDDKNQWPAPPLWLAIKTFLSLKASRQFFVEMVIQVIAFVKMGGIPALYSGEQKINPSAFSNFSTGRDLYLVRYSGRHQWGQLDLHDR